MGSTSYHHTFDSHPPGRWMPVSRRSAVYLDGKAQI